MIWNFHGAIESALLNTTTTSVGFPRLNRAQADASLLVVFVGAAETTSALTTRLDDRTRLVVARSCPRRLSGQCTFSPTRAVAHSPSPSTTVKPTFAFLIAADSNGPTGHMESPYEREILEFP